MIYILDINISYSKHDRVGNYKQDHVDIMDRNMEVVHINRMYTYDVPGSEIEGGERGHTSQSRDSLSQRPDVCTCFNHPPPHPETGIIESDEKSE